MNDVYCNQEMRFAARRKGRKGTEMDYLTKLEVLGNVATEDDVDRMDAVLDSHGIGWDDIAMLSDSQWESLLAEADKKEL